MYAEHGRPCPARLPAVVHIGCMYGRYADPAAFYRASFRPARLRGIGPSLKMAWEYPDIEEVVHFSRHNKIHAPAKTQDVPWRARTREIILLAAKKAGYCLARRSHPACFLSPPIE